VQAHARLYRLDNHLDDVLDELAIRSFSPPGTAPNRAATTRSSREGAAIWVPRLGLLRFASVAAGPRSTRRTGHQYHTRTAQWRNDMRIVIGNLPDDVTEEGIRESLSALAPVDTIALLKESGTPSAIIEMEMTREQAEALARRIQGRIYRGRELRAWVPVMPWK
jgi:hypothetical protein